MRKENITKMCYFINKLNIELFNNNVKNVETLRTRLYDLYIELGKYKKDWLEKQTEK